MRKNFTLYFILLFSLLLGSTKYGFGQLAVNSSATAAQLAGNIVGAGVTISNVNLQCAAGGYGLFSNGGTTNIGLTSGILLTTGDASDAIGPNNSGNTSRDKTNFNPDPDLAAITNYSIHDQCIFEFDFVAVNNTIQVKYVFASEEYNEWVCTQYNDLFGFFVTGPNPLGGAYASQNVARIAGTNLPVSINTINNGTTGSHGATATCQSLNNSSLYTYNTPGATIGYDGFTVTLTAQLKIIPGQTYHFKFAIADISDGKWDSGIFIKANSFSSFDCDAGTLALTTSPTIFCADDAIDDVVTVANTTATTSGNYNFLLTNSGNQILAINSTGVFNLASYGTGTYKIYGISNDGVVTGMTVGNNITAISANSNIGCFELSTPLTTSLNNCGPVLNCGSSTTTNIQCNSSLPPINPGSITVISQTCTGGAVTWVSDVPTGNACSGTVVRTYRLTDSCGNVGQCTQTYNYNDTTAPVISQAGSNQTINCGTTPVFTPPTATDNCIVPNIVELSDVTTQGTCTGTFTRTKLWRATDACGNNSVTRTQTITVADNTPPIFTSLPTSATVACNQMPMASSFSVMANDACSGNVSITSSFDDVNSGCNKVRTITWTATDACGNATSASRVFTSTDNVAPVLSGVPAMSTMECGQPVPAATVTAIDNCDTSPIISLSANTVITSCGNALVRTWTATDACGNSSSATQTTTYIDTTPPALINTPADGIVSCGLMPDGEDFAVGATDNCAGNIFITSSYIDQGIGCNISRTITWVATDACGNTSSVSRTFTSSDTSAPVIVGLPNSSTVNCGTLPSGDDFAVYANDNCDPTVAIQYAQSDENIGCNVSRTITWTATDNCGNVSTASRTFTSSDNFAPVLFGIPNASTLQCGQPIAEAVVSATDNCDASPIISMSAETISTTCGSSLVRTWTVTDACGNTSSASQTTTFIDTTPPVLNNLPDGGEVICMNLPTANNFAVTATDNCHTNLAVITSFDDDGAGCNLTRIITWSATDACGNTTTLSRIFTTSDLISPVLNNLPESENVACGSLPLASNYNVNATDNCDTNVSITSTFSDAGLGCNMVRTIIWTATDNCGNSTSATRIFTSQDLIAPVLINAPSDIVLECGQPVPPAVVSATDNCDQNVIISMSANTLSAPCGYSILRTWTATDACGNSSSVSQTTTFVDNTPPILAGIPANATVSCGNIPDADDFDVMATDNCVGDVMITSTISNTESGCNIMRVITWTASDACGNAVSATRTFISSDSSAPVLAALPTNTTVACGSLPTGDDFEVYANDNCDPSVQLQFTHTDNASGCNVVRTITWTATDNCGNTSSASRTFTSSDNINPMLVNVPENAVLECGQPVPDAVVSATDNCDGSPMVSMSASTVPLACGYSMIRTWTATDACGNTSSATQTTTFVDTTPPVIGNLPSAASMSCGEIPVASNFDVTATDNCVGEISITSTFADAGVGCNMTRTITWTATDACGNFSNASRTFSTSDNAPPVISGLPTNTTIACGALPEGGSLPVIATDNCDPTVSIQFTQNDEFVGCNKTRTITWTASDACGNSSSETRIFTSNDNVAPMIIGVPQNTTIQCGQPVPNAIVSAIDNCDSEPMVSMSANTMSQDCGTSLVRIWTAVDACGNTSTATQTTTFVDTTPPVLQNLPANATVVCMNLPTADDYDVSATDNCPGEVSVTSSFVDSGSGCTLIRVITWTATDACGNSVSASRNFSINDMTPPVFVNLPEGGETPCGQMPNGNSLGVTASDDCDPNVTVTTTYADNGTACNLTRVITWTATDLCGNTTAVTRTFISIDHTAPVLYGIPQNATMACGGQVPSSAVVAGDNCDENLEVVLSATTTQLECGYLFSRTWTVTDMCGNTTTATRTITYIDDVAPVLNNVPQDASFGCSDMPDESTFNVSAADNCDSNIAVEVSINDFGVGCGMFRTITWSASDHCGNVATASRTFTLNTNSPPTLIGVPENISLPYILVPEVPIVLAIDQCGNALTVAFNQIAGSGCPYTITRTWTASDGCGNEISATQVVTLFDYTPPLLLGAFDDLTLQCHETIPELVVTASDNCDPNTTITLSSQTQAYACGSLITKTWVATDMCGNSASASLQIYLIDETSPVFNTVPENITVDCGNVPPAPILTATDNCSPNVNIELSETNMGGGCPYLIKRVWTAYDDCGNSTYATQIVTVNDNIAPVFVEFPQLVQMECGTAGSYLPVATDNCTNDVVVMLVNEVPLPGECGNNLQRTYMATDQCGNSTTATQLVELIDTTPPVLHNVPGEMATQCGQPLPPIPTNITATDNCTPDMTVVFSQTFTSRACPYNIVRQWRVTDNCGNTTIQTQTIHVINPIAPRSYVSAQPNPAVSGQLKIKFSTPYDAQVVMSVYDASGREVLRLMDGNAMGAYVYEWTEELQRLSSGTYILKISVDGELQNKMISIMDR